MSLEATVESLAGGKHQPALIAVALTATGIASVIFTTCYAYHIGF